MLSTNTTNLGLKVIVARSTIKPNETNIRKKNIRKTIKTNKTKLEKPLQLTRVRPIVCTHPHAK
jgi:hypothetical protein